MSDAAGLSFSFSANYDITSLYAGADPPCVTDLTGTATGTAVYTGENASFYFYDNDADLGTPCEEGAKKLRIDLAIKKNFNCGGCTNFVCAEATITTAICCQGDICDPDGCIWIEDGVADWFRYCDGSTGKTYYNALMSNLTGGF